jgi:hypothetical protein
MSRKKKTILVLEEDHKLIKRLSSEQGRSMLAIVQDALHMYEQVNPLKENIVYARSKEKEKIETRN